MTKKYACVCVCIYIDSINAFSLPPPIFNFVVHIVPGTKGDKGILGPTAKCHCEHLKTNLQQSHFTEIPAVSIASANFL